jgi:outer membrane lipoprotein-sorting protein
MSRLLASIALLAFVLGVAPAPSATPADVIQKMVDRNPSLQTFRSRVHVNVRMLNFPFLAPKLDGTSYFKRPDNYVVNFDRMPGYAKGFSKLFDDVGDPASWGKDQNVVLDGRASLNGSTAIVLRLTKKIPSSILAYTLAFVDPKTYDLEQMEWHYTSGGTIVMTQTYRLQGSFAVISSQHATIDIPHIRAIADSTYGPYETNVAFANAVFAK